MPQQTVVTPSGVVVDQGAVKAARPAPIEVNPWELGLYEHPAKVTIQPGKEAEKELEQGPGVELYKYDKNAPPKTADELPPLRYTPPGVPLYQVAPPPDEKQSDLGYGAKNYTGMIPVDLGRAIVSGYNQGLEPVDKLGANIFHLLDTAATKIEGLTGLPKGGVFKHMEDYLRDRQKTFAAQASEAQGANPNLIDQLVSGTVSSAMGLPVMHAATVAGGPVLGMAGMGALENADQGGAAMAQGAVEQGLMGKFLHIVGPLGRVIRVPAVAAVEYTKNIAQGVDAQTALKNAMLMAGMTMMGPVDTKGSRSQGAPGGTSGAPPGGPSGGPSGSAAPPAAAPSRGPFPETEPNAFRQVLERTGVKFQNQLNPVQQAAVDYFREEGVPLTGGQLTGNKYLTAVEATTEHTPLGSQRAREFKKGTEEAIRGLAEELAGKVHNEPVTPYEGAKATTGELGGSIAELNSKATQAYDKAWEHAGKPEHDEWVPVRMRPEATHDYETGEPTGETLQPEYRYVNMPVDVRFMKQIAERELPKYKFLSAAEQSQSKAVSIYKHILEGDDYITAEQAEEALKGLKAESRKADNPEVRNVAEGAAARLIPELQKRIDAAVGKTGAENRTALQEGRKLHSQKMDLDEFAKKLRDEPVEAFGQLTRRKDGGAELLKAIAKRAPKSIPKLARAWIDQVFEKANNEGGWMRSEGVYKAWDDLGPQTRAILFPGEGQVAALNKFFLAQKITAERINKSGTQLVKAAEDAGTNILKWAKGKAFGDLLFSPKGIQFLTGIAQHPPRTSAEVESLRKQAEEAFKKTKPPEDGEGGGNKPKPPDEPPEGGGTPAPAAGGGAPPAPAGGEITPKQHFEVQKLASEQLGGTKGSPEGWREKLNEAADRAQGRIDKFFKDQALQFNQPLPLDVLADYSIVGARKIIDGAEKFTGWSKGMVDTFGEKVQPHLRSIWKEAQHIAGAIGWGKTGKAEMPLGKRLTVSAGPLPAGTPKIAKKPKLHLVEKSLKNLDAFHERNPEMFGSKENYLRGMNELHQPQDQRVPIPPDNLIAYATDQKAIEASVREPIQGQRDLATEGLAASKATGKLYAEGKMTPVDSGLYFGWAALSPRQSPYPQEAGFLHAIDGGLERWIKMAAKGKFNESTLPKYLEWAGQVLQGTPGAQATSNLNSFGEQFLMNSGKRVENGPYKGMRTIEALHEIIGDQKLSSVEARRRYQQINNGLGVDNKVFSFILLVTGHHDTLVADRVRINDFWDAPAHEKSGLAYTTNKKGDMDPTKNLYDNGFNSMWDGITGLGMYEAAEKALAARVKKAYADIGVEDGTLGRWHWETWLAKSGQEVSHGSLGAIAKKAREGITAKQAAVGESVRQGKYNDLSYGVRYERAPEGFQYNWTNSQGETVPLTREQHTKLLETLRTMRGTKRPKGYSKDDRVIPHGTKTSEATSAPWHELPGIDRASLDRLIERIAASKR